MGVGKGVAESPHWGSHANATGLALSSGTKLGATNKTAEQSLSHDTIFIATTVASMASKYAFTAGLREVRFHLCHSSPASEATRSFLKRAYPTMKKNNPNTPIMIREATGTEPKIWARYGYGKEKWESLNGLSDKEIEEKVTGLVKAEI